MPTQTHRGLPRGLHFSYCSTEGFDAFSEFVLADTYTPESVSEHVGLSPDVIRGFAQLIGGGGGPTKSKRVSFWWTMGVNQGHQAVRTAQALINLALMTGNIGRPGTGANSITGQCNAMGSRLFSNTTCLPAGRDFRNPEHREQVAQAFNIAADRVPQEASLAYDQILDRIHGGQIRALWVVATNGAHSWIHQSQAREAFSKLDVLVVQDMYTTTETAQMADIVLPAAGWGEKEGTFINSERRIGRIKRVRTAPGDALADFHIFRLIAEAWGCGELTQGFQSPEDVFQFMKVLSKDQPCDFTGIVDYAQLDSSGGVQWPLPSDHKEEELKERRLFSDGVFFRASQRAKFCFESYVAPPEPADEAYPFVLLTGRGSSSQWHTETRTKKSSVLRKLYPDRCLVEIHPQDAERLGISAEDQVSVKSRRGELQAFAAVKATVPIGHLFVAMHDAATNQLTYPSFDPYSRQPSYKHCAVSIARLTVR